MALYLDSFENIPYIMSILLIRLLGVFLPVQSDVNYCYFTFLKRLDLFSIKECLAWPDDHVPNRTCCLNPYLFFGPRILDFWGFTFGVLLFGSSLLSLSFRLSIKDCYCLLIALCYLSIALVWHLEESLTENSFVLLNKHIFCLVSLSL